ncbi:MAG: sigma-70 family RNA polymerase sigma factor [Planctomycetota bacterium]|nr:MAG: sigma-70 family RNA polymerase sigma factor [Planctomycetota bacterium]
MAHSGKDVANMARSQSSREPITFQKLLVEARAGSAEALGKILISFTTELHRRAESFVHPPSLQAKGNAADLVQTTFVEAQRNLKQFHGTTREEFLAWLLGILTHNAKDWRASFLRTAKRQLKRELSLDHPKLGAVLRRNLFADTPAPITSLMQDEVETVLRRRIGELPERYARVIRMHSMEELPFEKVAQALRCSAEAARKVYRRAITQLSESLRDIV